MIPKIQINDGVDSNTVLIVAESPDHHDRLVASANGTHRAMCRQCSWQSEPYGGMFGELQATVAANVHGMTGVKIVMTTMSDDLITWLRAQLDEDERVAREASGDPWVTGTSVGYPYSRPGDVYAIAHDGTAARIAMGTRCGPDISAEQSSDHIARHDPARVLAEVEAKRRILNWLDMAEDWMFDKSYGGQPDCDTVRSLLALPYADRAGFMEDWRV